MLKAFHCILDFPINKIIVYINFAVLLHILVLLYAFIKTKFSFKSVFTICYSWNILFAIMIELWIGKFVGDIILHFSINTIHLYFCLFFKCRLCLHIWIRVDECFEQFGQKWKVFYNAYIDEIKVRFELFNWFFCFGFYLGLKHNAPMVTIFIYNFINQLSGSSWQILFCIADALKCGMRKGEEILYLSSLFLH